MSPIVVAGGPKGSDRSVTRLTDDPPAAHPAGGDLGSTSVASYPGGMGAVLVYLHGVGGVRPGWAEGLLAQDDLGSVRIFAPTYTSILTEQAAPLGFTTGVPHPDRPAGFEVDAQARAAYRNRQRSLAERIAASPDVVPAGLSWPPILPRPTRWPILDLLESPARFIAGLDQARRYVRDPLMRRRVIDHVRAALDSALDDDAVCDSDSVVLVGHSLGAVVALDLFAELDRHIDLLVTLGSPLGHPDIAERLADRGVDVSRLGGWMNVVHLLDPVPLGRGAAALFPAATDAYLPVLAGGRGLSGLARGVARAATAHLDQSYLSAEVVRTVIAEALSRPAGVPA